MYKEWDNFSIDEIEDDFEYNGWNPDAPEPEEREMSLEEKVDILGMGLFHISEFKSDNNDWKKERNSTLISNGIEDLFKDHKELLFLKGFALQILKANSEINDYKSRLEKKQL